MVFCFSKAMTSTVVLKMWSRNRLGHPRHFWGPQGQNHAQVKDPLEVQNKPTDFDVMGVQCVLIWLPSLRLTNFKENTTY